VIRRIDPVGRAAYGVLCIAGMASLAVPLLLVAGCVAGLLYAQDGEGGKGLAVWLISWAFAAFAALLFLGILYAAWPLASDWVIEWPGYAAGYAVGGAGLLLMAALVFARLVPLYAAVILPLAGTFVAGFIVAGRLPGARATASSNRARSRSGRRR